MASRSESHTAPPQGWAPLTRRCRFRLSGTDRVRYLNGQVTNQIEGLACGEARAACVTNHKGQLEAEVMVSSGADPETSEEVLWIDADETLRDSLGTRLDRYLIADDAELTDVTEAWTGVHLLGVTGETLNDLKQAKGPEFTLTYANRFGPAGWDLWAPAHEDFSLLEPLGFSALEESFLEWLRISHGIPQWGAELTPGLLPPEARLEGRAIHYEKGCYIGQEVISRIKSVGKVNRLLTLMRLEQDSTSGLELLPGQSLQLKPETATETDAPSVGLLTSVVAVPPEAHPAGEMLALGLVKSQHAAPETRLLAIGEQASAELVILPFPAAT